MRYIMILTPGEPEIHPYGESEVTEAFGEDGNRRLAAGEVIEWTSARKRTFKVVDMAVASTRYAAMTPLMRNL